MTSSRTSKPKETVSVGFEQEKYTENDQIQFCKDIYLNPQLRKKLRMRWFFDVSKVKESSFFKSDLTDLTLDAHLFENINFSFSKLNALKKFHFDKEMRKKGQCQIELWCSQS